MKYIRRIYYSNENGEIIFHYSQSGEMINIFPLEHDFAVYPQLADRTEEDTGCLEWQERDEEKENKLTGVEYIARVDVTQMPHVLVFDMPPEDPDHELTDTEAIAIMLGDAE